MELTPSDALGISVEHRSSLTIVALAGELDAFTTPRLLSVVGGVIDAGHDRVVLELRDLRFCDSTGVTAFLDLHHRLEAAGGRLELRNPCFSMQKVLEITALDRLLHVAV